MFVSAGVAAPARALFAAARAAASETCSLTMAEARALVAVSAGAAAPEIVRTTSPVVAVASRGAGAGEGEEDSSPTAGSALKLAPVAAAMSLSTLPCSGAAGGAAKGGEAPPHDDDDLDSRSASASGPATSSLTECLAPTPPQSASTSLTHASRAETAGQEEEGKLVPRMVEGAGEQGEPGEAANEAENALRNSCGGGDADDDAREAEGERPAAASGVEGQGDCGVLQKSPPGKEEGDEAAEQEEESCTTRSAVAGASAAPAPDSPPPPE